MSSTATYQLRDWIDTHIVYSSPILSANPHEAVREYLKNYPDRIDWKYLSRNPADWALNLLRKNQDKINWDHIIYNRSVKAFELIKVNLAKLSNNNKIEYCMQLLNHPNSNTFDFIIDICNDLSEPCKSILQGRLREYFQSKWDSIRDELYTQSIINNGYIPAPLINNNTSRIFKITDINQLKMVLVFYKEIELQNVITGMIHICSDDILIDVLEKYRQYITKKFLKGNEWRYICNPNIFIEINPKPKAKELTPMETLRAEFLSCFGDLQEQLRAQDEKHNVDMEKLKQDMLKQQDNHQAEIAELKLKLIDQEHRYETEIDELKLANNELILQISNYEETNRQAMTDMRKHFDKDQDLKKRVAFVISQWEDDKKIAIQEAKTRELTAQINELVIKRYVDEQIKDLNADLMKYIDVKTQSIIGSAEHDQLDIVDQLSKTMKAQFASLIERQATIEHPIVKHYEMLIKQIHDHNKLK